MTNHPIFRDRPRENTDFSNAVSKYLNANGLACVTVNGVFDLLICSKSGPLVKFVELKVSLKSGGYPASPLQWEFFHSMPSSIESNFRLYVYDNSAKRYCLASLDDVQLAIPGDKKFDTWYLRRRHLKTLTWLEPKEAYDALVDWAKRP